MGIEQPAVMTPPQGVRAYPQVALLIDGEWITDRPACHVVENPASGQALSPVPAASPADIERALAAAARDFAIWRKTTAEARAAILLKAAEIMRTRLEDIAQAVTLEHGKSIADARAEVTRAISFLQWDAAEAQRLYGRIVPTAAGMTQVITRVPIGTVAAFTPWNVPISAAGRKVGGALAAGCAVILKPASQTSGASCLMAQCFLDAGVPSGAIQVLHGSAAKLSQDLLLSPVVAMVSLTGSVEVGKSLTALAAKGMKPVVMELGGHAPVLIAKDVDPETVAALAAASKFRMAGQICVSPSRFFIEDEVYDRFVAAFAKRADAVRVGEGFEPDVQMGPVLNEGRVKTMEHLVADACAKGARLAAGGIRLPRAGHFFAPTVLADVPEDAAILHEEPFGPIAACVRVKDMDEALERANALELGLAGYVFTNDTLLAQKLLEELECGAVAHNVFATPGANAPFGGHKESGIGVEGGAESLEAYTVSKATIIRHAKV